jgi:hypothetical protein
MRRALASVAATVALLAATAQPAAAHGGLALTVNDDGRGNVSVDVVWLDGHPVTEAIAGTMTATSATDQVGPVALSRLPGTGTIVYDKALGKGSWQVTVDVGLPGVGHCVAAVAVPSTTPGTTRCGEPVVAAGQPAVARPAPVDGWPVWATVGLVLLALAGVAVLARRMLPAAVPHRGRPKSRPRTSGPRTSGPRTSGPRQPKPGA